MNISNTKFDPVKINELLYKYDNVKRLIKTYGDFASIVPLMKEKDLNFKLNSLINNNALKSCSFMTTSGTSGAPKLMAISLWRTNCAVNSYSKSLKELIQNHVISDQDIVANLFSAGGFSTLYDSCNRLLESIGASIIPIGHLNMYPALQERFIKLMGDLQTNVLLGTPSSIIFCLNLCKKLKLFLPIKKIIFTGEKLSKTRRSIIAKEWPGVRIYGLYGHTETGFVGINTPECKEEHYHILEDWYFIETNRNNEVILTNLANPLVPLIRYPVGDRGELKRYSCKCGIYSSSLHLKGRSDKKFNYAGNLISFNHIKDIISNHFQKELDIQVQLETSKVGVDDLSIVIDIDDTCLKKTYERLLQDTLAFDDISECVKMCAGTVRFLSNDHFIYSSRQKLNPVIDLR